MNTRIKATFLLINHLFFWVHTNIPLISIKILCLQFIAPKTWLYFKCYNQLASHLCWSHPYILTWYLMTEIISILIHFRTCFKYFLNHCLSWAIIVYRKKISKNLIFKKSFYFSAIVPIVKQRTKYWHMITMNSKSWIELTFIQFTRYGIVEWNEKRKRSCLSKRWLKAKIS
jgi:hypothetical protein